MRARTCFPTTPGGLREPPWTCGRGAETRDRRTLRPARWPFFYGWVIVAVAFVGSGIGSGISIWGTSVFVLPMTEELGWSRTEFFSAFAVRAVVVGLTAPVVGPWLDTRHGPRLMAIGSAFVLAGSMALLSYVEHLWQFLLLYGLFGGLAELGGGFVVLITVLPKWFVAKRGRALGIATMGVGLGALIFPASVSALVDAEGWRTAWVWFGAVTGTIWLLLALLVRTRPEDVGLQPDGARSAPEAPSPGAPIAPASGAIGDGAGERSLTRGEALRTPAFWLLLAASSLISMGIMGFQTNWLPFLLEGGFSVSQAAAGIAVYGLVSGLSRPVWGLVAERVPPRYLLAASAAATSAVIVLFLNVGSGSVLAASMAAAGVSMGGYLILHTLLVANYFGRAHLGGVESVFRPFMLGAGALSPLLFGVLYDLRGDYVAAFLVAAAAWLAAGVIVLAARPPGQRASRGRKGGEAA